MKQLLFILGIFLFTASCENTKNVSKIVSLTQGDQVPSFILKDQKGNNFNIDELIGEKNLVIYFYTKDETSVCTAQASSFRDNYQDFTDLGAEVIGISSDSEDSHQKFAANHNLPFILLSDNKQTVRNTFGVPTDMLGLLPGRYTYVVNKKGEIILVFNSALNAQKHIDAALEALKK